MSCCHATLLLSACCDAAPSVTAATALPLLPHCCRAASVTLPPPLLLSCISTHNKVNEWAFINPMAQYYNQQKTMFQCNNQQNNGLMNGHSLNTMTPYNNQQEGHVSSAAESTR
jgi:hypothetical protein